MQTKDVHAQTGTFPGKFLVILGSSCISFCVKLKTFNIRKIKILPGTCISHGSNDVVHNYGQEVIE